MNEILKKRIPVDLFQNTTTSYKFFWAISLLQLYKAKKQAVYDFRIIIARMIAEAWFVLKDNKIALGGADHLRSTVKTLSRTYDKQYKNADDLFALFERDIHTKTIRKCVGYYTENVPYRFLTPWVGTKMGRSELSKQEVAFKLDAPYLVESGGTDRVVRLNPEWRKCLDGIEDKLITHVIDKLAVYIQKRNPNILGGYSGRLKYVILGGGGEFSLSEKISVSEPPLPEIKGLEDPIKEDALSVQQTVVGVQNLKDSASALVGDKVVAGKLIDINDELLLEKISPLLESSKLDVISILSDHYKDRSDVQMSFMDWANFVQTFKPKVKIEATFSEKKEHDDLASPEEKVENTPKYNATLPKATEKPITSLEGIAKLCRGALPIYKVKRMSLGDSNVTIEVDVYSNVHDLDFSLLLEFSGVTYFHCSLFMGSPQSFRLTAINKGNRQWHYKFGNSTISIISSPVNVVDRRDCLQEDCKTSRLLQQSSSSTRGLGKGGLKLIDAVILVLGDRGVYMSPRAIWDFIDYRKYFKTQGKTPVATISAYMSSSHKQFFKQRSGEYTLSDIGKQRYKEIKKGMF